MSPLFPSLALVCECAFGVLPRSACRRLPVRDARPAVCELAESCCPFRSLEPNLDWTCGRVVKALDLGDGKTVEILQSRKWQGFEPLRVQRHLFFFGIGKGQKIVSILCCGALCFGAHHRFVFNYLRFDSS